MNTVPQDQPDGPVTGADAAVATHFVSAASLRERLDWLNRLRWGAAVGVVAGAALAGPRLKLDLAPPWLLAVAAGLAILNALYVLRNRRRSPTDIAVELRLVKLQMVADLLILTTLLNLTGGLENPFFFIYIIHVILASLLFHRRDIFRIAGLAIVLFSGMVVGEYLDLLPHRHVAGAGQLGHGLPFVVAGLGAFWLVMFVCAYLGASVTAHNRAIKDDLVAQQELLEQANRDKTEFYRFVTHEIKSPIGTAQSAVHAALDLEGAGLSDQARGLLDRALARLDQATVIVRELADLKRGGGLSAANIRRIDVNSIAAAVVERHAEAAAARELPLVWHPAPGPALIRTDPDMVDKVVANLIGNALHYGGRGQVAASTAVTADEVRLVVADREIGIPADEIARVFDEFYRARGARELSRHGTGLGLAIVRRFMERMGGRVALESQVGVGSVFTVAWPRSAEGVA